MKKKFFILPVLLILGAGIVFAATFGELFTNTLTVYNNATIGNGTQIYSFDNESFISERNITVNNANVSADYFVGDGSLLTGISSYEHPDYIDLNNSLTATGDTLTVLRNPTLGAGFYANTVNGITTTAEMTAVASTTFLAHNLYGHSIDVREIYSGFTGSNFGTSDGIRMRVALDGEAYPALNSPSDGLDLHIRANRGGNIFGAFTKATNVGTGSALGYQGFGSNSGSGTGLNAVGVYGFAQSTNGLSAGLQASSFGTGAKDFSYYGVQGTWWMKGANMYLWETETIREITDTRHIPVSDKGSLFVENNFQVNDTSYISVPYAEVYNVTLNGYTLSIPSLNTWYNFTGLLEGEMFGFTLESNGINATYEGVYKVDYAVSFSGSGGSTHAIGLLINGVEHTPCRIYRKLGTAGDVGNAGGTCIITLDENDIVSGAVQDVSSPAQNINVWSMNANIIRIGNR